MLFNSLQFLVFFIVVTSLYFLLPHKYRWFLLLASSCYFYMAFVPIYILILGFTIVVDYFAGLLIENHEGKKRRIYLIASLVANIGVLAVFKYYNFINDNLSAMLGAAGYHNPIPFLSILLPIGLSFHTFQAMSYTIEVYRGKQKAEKSFGIYALYVMFYPQLVAGPIERPQNLIHQFREKHNFDYKRITDGLKLMAWGLFKKIVIADRIAAIVDNVYNNPHEYHGLSMIIATIFFAFQIYCDFSGYSDMAIGIARVMGFKLMTNFDRPYHSRSISEFWKRWHISLSTWFKDYLYISLGGNRVSVPRWYFNLLFVFVISGLWHGANWTFVIWGALNGFYLIFAIVTQKSREKLVKFIRLDKVPVLYNFLQIVVTFALTCFAWIFFRASSFSAAIYIIKHSFTGLATDLATIASGKPLNLNLGETPLQITIGIGAIIVMEIVHIIQYKFDSIESYFAGQNKMVRWALYYSLVFVIVFFGIHSNRQFIYFQF